MADNELNPGIAWKSDKQNINLDFAINTGFLLLMVVLLLVNSASTQLLVSFAGTTNIVLIVTILLAISLGSKYYLLKTGEYGGLGQGSTPKQIFLISLVVGVVMAASSFSLIPNLSILAGVTLFLTGFVIPYAEESVFGQILPFILNSMFKNWIVVDAGTASLFAGFHIVAYQAVAQFIIAAFIFRIVVMYGNKFFKTSAFGLGLHFGNNIVTILSVLHL